MICGGGSVFVCVCVCVCVEGGGSICEITIFASQTYRSCKEKMGGGGGVAIGCSREEQTQCHLCR